MRLIVAVMPALLMIQAATAEERYYFRAPGTVEGAAVPLPDARVNVPGTGTIEVLGPAFVRMTEAGLPLRLRAFATGGTIAWASVGQPLPEGVSLSKSGVLSGIPAATGTYPGIVLEARDTTGDTGRTQPFTIVSGMPDVDLRSQPTSYRLRWNAPFALQPAARNIAGAAAWSFVPLSGNLPTGLVYEAGYPAVMGTVLGTGSATFAFDLADTADGLSARSTSVSVETAPPLGIAGLAGAYRVRAGRTFATDAPLPSGYKGTPAYSLDPAPPSGTGLSGGTLAGMAAVSAARTYTLTATDPWDQSTASASFTLAVLGPISLSMGSVAVQSGEAFSRTASLDNAIGPATFALLQNGSPAPTGLAPCAGVRFLEASGTIVGPSTSDCSIQNLSLRAVDADGDQAVSPSFSVSVVTPPYAQVTGFPDRTRSGKVSKATLATNIPTPAWSFTSNPAGLGVAISGATATLTAPAVPSQRSYALTATASAGGKTASVASTLIVHPGLTLSYAPGRFAVGTNALLSPGAGGIVGAKSFRLLRAGVAAPNALDACGLSLGTSDGVISGTTKACSVDNLQVELTDQGTSGLPPEAVTSATFDVTAAVYTADTTPPKTVDKNCTNYTLNYAVPTIADRVYWNDKYRYSPKGYSDAMAYVYGDGGVLLASAPFQLQGAGGSDYTYGAGIVNIPNPKPNSSYKVVLTTVGGVEYCVAKVSGNYNGQTAGYY